MKCSFPRSLEAQNGHLAQSRDAYACLCSVTAFGCARGCSAVFGTGSWRASSAADLREFSLHFGPFTVDLPFKIELAFRRCLSKMQSTFQPGI